MTIIEQCHNLGVFVHVVAFVPLVVAFATNPWATFEDQGAWNYGLWNICYRGNSSAYNYSSSGGYMGITPHPELECQRLKIGNLPGLFHVWRTFLCLAVIVYVLAFMFKCNWQCNSQDKDMIRRSLKVQATEFVLIFGGVCSFNFHKDAYDKEKSIHSSFGGSAIVTFIVCALQLVALSLTSSPLLKKACKRCRKRLKTCCKRNNSTVRTGSNSSATRSSTTSDRPTTTVIVTTRRTSTRTVATSTSSTDLSSVEIPRPPPYSEHQQDFNSWFDRYIALSRLDNVPGSQRRSSNTRMVRRGSSAVAPDSPECNIPPSSRPASGGVFTVIVNPASSSTTTREQHHHPPPPPRYEERDTNISTQQLRNVHSVPPTAPPPAYEESTIHNNHTTENLAGGSDARSRPLTLDSSLLIGERWATSPPPSYSDV